MTPQAPRSSGRPTSANNGLRVRTSGSEPAALIAAATPGSSASAAAPCCRSTTTKSAPVRARTSAVTAPGSRLHSPWHGCPSDHRRLKSPSLITILRSALSTELRDLLRQRPTQGPAPAILPHGLDGPARTRLHIAAAAFGENDHGRNPNMTRAREWLNLLRALRVPLATNRRSRCAQLGAGRPRHAQTPPAPHGSAATAVPPPRNPRPVT